MRIALSHQTGQDRLHALEIFQARADVGQLPRGKLRRFVAMGTVLQREQLGDLMNFTRATSARP
jgi:hypothetical protein